MLRKLLPALVLVTLAACQPTQRADAKGGAAETVTIMNFNVENLFDTRHDPGKNDYTYLPLASKQNAAHRERCAKITVARWREQCLEWDWSEAVLRHKLATLAQVILQVGEGRGADIVVLQEVENLAVLERLRREYLGAANYRPAVLLEGPDERGIDVAFLSRLPLAGEPKLRRIPFEGFPPERVADTRSILEATFELPDGSQLTGFAVHFPAPFHPYQMREQAYSYLAKLRAELPPGRAAFAAGDFNTTSEEVSKQRMLARFVRPHWQVAHESGCEACPGTYYYPPTDSWSFLDMILWSPAAGGAWRLKPGSAQLANAVPEQRKPGPKPKRFEIDGPSGVSDHWPLVVSIERGR